MPSMAQPTLSASSTVADSLVQFSYLFSLLVLHEAPVLIDSAGNDRRTPRVSPR